MSTIRKTACLLTLLATAACGSDGYYDNSGHYHNSGNYTYGTGTPHSPYTRPIGESDDMSYNHSHYNDRDVVYNKAGYYDHNGNYVTMETGPRIPAAYLPPRGMCRVWFNDRPLDEQPAIESCADIQDRVPMGAYVVYGGAM